MPDAEVEYVEFEVLSPITIDGETYRTGDVLFLPVDSIERPLYANKITVKNPQKEIEKITERPKVFNWVFWPFNRGSK